MLHLLLVALLEMCDLTFTEAYNQILKVSRSLTKVLTREAADEVMISYRNTLDKINGARDKTDNNIDRLKTLMS